MRRARWVGLGISLALIWGASLWVVRASGEPEGLDHKFTSAEQVVFYRLLPGEGVRLRLPAGPDTVRLMSHLVVPRQLAYSAERQFVYGLQVALIGEDGAPLLQRSLFTRTRQSKAELVDGVWAKESAFTLEDDNLGDPREFVLPLPESARARFVEVRVAQGGAPVLVRAYGRSRVFQGLSLSEPEPPRRVHQKLESSTYLPFEKLHPHTQEALAAERWERLGAEGEAGIDYRPTRVYRTEFRIPLTEVAETDRERVAAGASVATNVIGPADLVLRLWREPGEGELPGELAVVLLGADGARTELRLPRPEGTEVATHAFHVPEGVHTVALHNGPEGEVRYLLEGPDSAWLAPPSLKAGAIGTTALLPHVVKSEAWVAGPGCSELELEVEIPDARRAPALRVDARLLAPGAAGERGELRIALFDASGRRVDAGTLPVFGDVERYETVELGHRVSPALPCERAEAGAAPAPMAVTEEEVRASEAVTSRVVLPPGTRRVRLSATRPIAVQLHSLLVAERGARPEPPYDRPRLQKVRWHYSPLDARSWHPLRPMNHGQLGREGARVEVRMQVRLVPEGDPAPRPGRGEAVTLTPARLPPSLELLEADPDAELADAERDLLTVLTPGEPVKVHFDARAATRPELRLGLDDPAALGQAVVLEIDGKTVLERVLRSTRGRELLPPIEPGDHLITVRTEAAGLEAILNRPPAKGDALRRRRVYRLAEEGLRVPVTQGQRAVTLNVVVYAPTREAADSLRVELDGGQPARRTGVFVPRLTPGVRTFALPPSVSTHAFVHGQPQGRWYPRRIAIRLGEDLRPGRHWVTISSAKGAPLWARFFVYGHAETDEPQGWTRPGWEEDAL